MKNPLWIRWWPAAAVDDMSDLTAMEELAYRRILDHIFKSNDRLRDDDAVMPTITKAGRQWRAIKASLIDKGKIEVAGGLIRNRRATETCIETASYRARQSAAAECSHGDGKRLNKKKTRSAVADAVAPAIAPAVAPASYQLQEEALPTDVGSGEAAPRREPPTEVKSTQQALPLLAVIQGGGDPAGPESEAERIKRQLWAEGVMIISRLSPELPADKVRMLIGQGAKALGGGTQVVQALRDVELQFATAGYAGDPVAAIRGFFHQRAGTGRAAKAAALAAPESATEMKARLRAQGAI